MIMKKKAKKTTKGSAKERASNKEIINNKEAKEVSHRSYLTLESFGDEKKNVVGRGMLKQRIWVMKMKGEWNRENELLAV
jgi:hypothetical protein